MAAKLKSVSSFWFVTTALLAILSVVYFVRAPVSVVGVICIIFSAGLIILSTLTESSISFWVVTIALLGLLSLAYFVKAPAIGLGGTYIIIGVSLIVLYVIAEIKQRQVYKAYF